MEQAWKFGIIVGMVAAAVILVTGLVGSNWEAVGAGAVIFSFGLFLHLRGRSGKGLSRNRE